MLVSNGIIKGWWVNKMCVLCMSTGRCHKNVVKSVEIACTNLQLFKISVNVIALK
jgi:hypothetical protein